MVDHVIADPPYEEEAHSKHLRQVVSVAGVRTIQGFEIPYERITEDQRATSAAHFDRICQRWCLVFCQVEAAHKWRASFLSLEYIRTGFWDCPNRQPQYSGDRPAQPVDAICIMHPKGRKRWNGGGKRAMWKAIRDSTGKSGVHQGHKPLALMEALVLDFTDEGDLVCDPFAGSGTTAIACLKHGRRFIGWELNAEFFDMATRRIEGRPRKVEGQEELWR
jgi:site-specific DNA-methyltransferase (adenine-specific)